MIFGSGGKLIQAASGSAGGGGGGELSVSFTDEANGATLGQATFGSGSVSADYAGPSIYNSSMTVGNWTAGSFITSSSSNTDVLTRSAKASQTYGITFNGAGSSGSPFNVIFDLGQVRTFNLASYYQMFSDGKTTHAALDISSTGNLETRTSANWTQVHDYVLLDNSSTSDGAQATFSPQTSQYIRLRIYNDGRYGDGSYTELYHMKLFSGSP